MAEFPALPLFTDAYLADTAHLTNEEHGAYLRLLMFAWRSPDCSLPDDDKRLAIMVGVSPKKWQTLRAVISTFWTIENGRWMQKRLTRERDFVTRQSEKGRDAAAARWRGKSLKLQDTGDASASAGHMPEPCQTDAPTPTYKKEEEYAREAKTDPKADLFLNVLAACGMNGGPLPTYWMPPAAEVHVSRWRSLGLTDEEILSVVRESQRDKPERPRGPKAFDGAMARLARAKTEPIQESTTRTGGRSHERQAFDRSIAELSAGLSSGAVKLDDSDRDPFAAR